MGALTSFRSILTFGLAVMYLANVFLKSSLLNDIDIMLLVIIIILSFPFVSKSSKMIGYTTFIISIVLLLVYKAPLSVWMNALEENLYLVVMFTLVPLLGIPIEHGGYFEALKGSFRLHINTDSRFYLFVSFLSAFMGTLVNLAVVPMVYQISKASERSMNARLISSALSRGFTTCTIWAPTTAAVALVLQLTGAKWTYFFPFAFLCGILCGLVGYVLNIFEQRIEKIPVNTMNRDFNISESEVQWKKVAELVFMATVLIGSIVVLSHITGIMTIIIVSLASLIVPLLWMGIIKRLTEFYRAIKEEYYPVSLPKLKNEIILFIGAGLLATSISYSHIGDIIPTILNMIVGQNVILLSIVIIVSTIILSIIGVHPIISVAVFSSTVNASVYHVSPTYLALILAISWAMGITVSPSAATIISISGLTGLSPVTIGPRWNGICVMISTIILILSLTLIRLTGLI